MEPDGRTVAFVSARHETRDEDAASDVFTVSAEGGDPVRVTATDLTVSRPAFSPDGGTIWFCGTPIDLAGRTTGLWSVPADGSAPPRRLTDPERYDHGDPAWSPDGRTVAFVSARHESRDEDAASDVFVVPAEGGDPVRVTATDLAVAAEQAPRLASVDREAVQRHRAAPHRPW